VLPQEERPKTLEEWARSKHLSLTLIFTDIVQSTKIGIKLGDTDWIEDLFLHFDRARELASHYDCHVVKAIGDSLMMAFSAPSAAVKFAVDFSINTGVDYIGIRVAIYSGEVHIRDNDIYGLTVNHTSRVQKYDTNGRDSSGRFGDERLQEHLRKWLSDHVLRRREGHQGFWERNTMECTHHSFARGTARTTTG
jgi:class 3 adenylate cyclase